MLRGKTVLVTGSSQGIGFAVAREMAAAGADVVVTSERPANDVPPIPGSTFYVQADLTRDGEADRLVGEAWAWS